MHLSARPLPSRQWTPDAGWHTPKVPCSTSGPQMRCPTGYWAPAPSTHVEAGRLAAPGPAGTWRRELGEVRAPPTVLSAPPSSRHDPAHRSMATPLPAGSLTAVTRLPSPGAEPTAPLRCPAPLASPGRAVRKPGTQERGSAGPGRPHWACSVAGAGFLVASRKLFALHRRGGATEPAAPPCTAAAPAPAWPRGGAR